MKHNASRWLTGALAFALFAPGLSNASFVLDTGTATSTAGATAVSPTEWLAAEFTLTSTENVTALSAYLAQLPTQVGTAFTFDIYGSAGFTSTRVTSLGPVATASGTYTGSTNGTGVWDTTNVSVTLAPGTYWLALQMTSSGSPGRGNTQGLEAPGAGLSTASGTAPAQAFAFYGTNTNSDFTTTGAMPVGLEITASPVPLPAAIWLLSSGVAGLGALRRRRSASA